MLDLALTDSEQLVVHGTTLYSKMATPWVTETASEQWSFEDSEIYSSEVYAPISSQKLDDEGLVENGKLQRSERLINRIQKGLIGNKRVFQTAFGPRPLVYADWTASSRCLDMIEGYIQREVLPFYANTHTESSVTGLQTSCFREEARQIIAEAVNAKITGRGAEDVVLFTGQGCTGAVNTLALALGLSPATAATVARAGADRPVVLVGPYEHHSNLLIWRESGAEVVQIPERAYSAANKGSEEEDSEGNILSGRGGLDKEVLKRELARFADRNVRICSFSAASNVSGVLEDVDGVTAIAHCAGALCFWDYAAAAPYTKIDMNPVVGGSERALVYKDAVFISPHKFVGGPGASGVLVVKKRLLMNDVPVVPGGGTVFFVSKEDHRFFSKPVEREEGGTPNILGSVRAGLAFHLKSRVGLAEIERRERAFAHKAVSILGAHENVVVLGGTSAERLPIFSFLIRCGGRFLHYGFVSAILNDLFGVQSRGGCMCAGPYAQQVLGMGAEAVQRFELALLARHEYLRPGFTRVSFPYFMPEDQVDFVLSAIALIAEHGWRLLPLYRMDPITGLWKHHARATSFPERRWLSKFDFDVEDFELDQDQDRTRRANADQATGDPSESENNAKDESEIDQRGNDDRTFAKKGETTSTTGPETALRMSLEGILEEARRTMLSVHEMDFAGSNVKLELNEVLQRWGLEEAAEDGGEEAPQSSLRWFVLPAEALATLQKEKFGDASAEEALRRMEMEYRVHGAICPGRKIQTGVKENSAVRQQPQQQSGGKGQEEGKHSQAERNGYGPGSWQVRRLAQEAQKLNAKYPSRTEALSKNHANISTINNKMKRNGAEGVSAMDQKEPQSSHDDGKGERVTKGDVDNKHKSKKDEKEEQAEEQKNDNKMDDDNNKKGSHKVEVEEPEAEQEAPVVACLRRVGAVSRAMAERAKGAPLFPKPPKKLVRKVGMAIADWGMIEEGDRLLLGLSGGKDSLALLHVLHQMQKRSPVKFELAAATVDPCTPSFDPSPLIGYMESLKIPYFYLKEKIIERASCELQGDSLCAYCSRMKRGLLYSCCRNNNFNKLVLAQHLDDLGESFIMSSLHNGQVRTMKAKYLNDSGDVCVIRPLVYTRESETKEFSYQGRLPVINENCPACFEEPKERHRVKKMLAREESLHPELFNILKRALTPFMDERIYLTLSEIMKDLEDRRGRWSKRKRKNSGRNGNMNKSPKEAANEESEHHEISHNKIALESEKEIRQDVTAKPVEPSHTAVHHTPEGERPPAGERKRTKLA